MTSSPSGLDGLLLVLVPGLPLLLLIPTLLRHQGLRRWTCHLALLPSLLLLLIPGSVSIDLPWILLGSGLGIDGASRWLLAMSVMLWATAATLLMAPAGGVGKRFRAFFLLTMAGSLGAILSTELVGFFAYSALMGYGLYGLLVDTENQTARRAGRLYLGLLIVADLILFDALLIAATLNQGLSFTEVRHAVALSPSPGLYVALVLVGFGLKAGFWPMHFWLAPAFASARPAVALLLGGVPIATGLIGILRWLPLGEVELPDPSLIAQAVGAIAMVYAIAVGVRRARLKELPAYAVVIATGLFAVALGAGLADPAAWNRHQHVAPLFIACLGIGLAVLVAAIEWLWPKTHRAGKPTDDGSLWFERWYQTALAWAGPRVSDRFQGLQSAWLSKAERIKQIDTWGNRLDEGERSLQRWPLAITLFLLLAMVIVFVVAFVGTSTPIQ